MGWGVWERVAVFGVSRGVSEYLGVFDGFLRRSLGVFGGVWRIFRGVGRC